MTEQDNGGWAWWAGRDEEYFSYGGPCKTREEAIEAGRESADEDGFFIIEALPYRLRLDAEQLIEAQYFEADDYFGEQDDPDRLGDHEAADQELQALLDAWIEKHRATFLQPTMFANQRHLEWIEPLSEPPHA